VSAGTEYINRMIEMTRTQILTVYGKEFQKNTTPEELDVWVDEKHGVRFTNKKNKLTIYLDYFEEEVTIWVTGFHTHLYADEGNQPDDLLAAVAALKIINGFLSGNLKVEEQRIGELIVRASLKETGKENKIDTGKMKYFDTVSIVGTSSEKGEKKQYSITWACPDIVNEGKTGPHVHIFGDDDNAVRI
jgi:hypothetical protein